MDERKGAQYHSHLQELKTPQSARVKVATQASRSISPYLRNILSRTPTISAAEHGQSITPLRKRAQIQRIWNSSPLNPNRLRQRREKPQKQKEAGQTSGSELSSTNQASPQDVDNLPRGPEGSLESFNRGEIVWGPHADFELRERSNSIRSRTPRAEICSDMSDAVRPRASEQKSIPSTPVIEKPTKQKLQVSFDRSPSQIQRGSGYVFPKIEGAEDPARKLKKSQLIRQRVAFFLIVFCLNTACLVAALTSYRHLWVLVLILFLKAKDILSTLGAVAWIASTSVFRPTRKIPEISPKWILACVTAYAETEAQIMRTISSVVEHPPASHKLVICIILDGKPVKIRSYFTRIAKTMRRPYQTWKFAHGELNIYTGFMEQVPVIIFEKVRNAGKKDSLILCHDLFDEMRDNISVYTRALRREIWTDILPSLLDNEAPTKFDYIFCTDADSLIHEGTLESLVIALVQDQKAIAACGLVLAEMQKGNEWSIWYLFQQFQYTFGQFVRRRAEGIWGRVTCLPGCVTMICVRKEMAGAIKLYAEPVTDRLVFQHQVQYLGTDRRLTYCMLSQGKHLRTLFVPHAVSETVAPQGYFHYMSQRRRWGSNAYFNDYFYFTGPEHWIVTRLWALIDIVRQTLVYYRVANTIMFVYGLYHHFVFIKLVPYIVVTQTPTVWFVVLVLFHEPILRKQAHKLFCGWVINKFLSPIFSVLIFTNIIINLGSAVWGRTGASTEPTNALDILHTITPKKSWTPRNIATLVREVIRERTRKAAEGPQREVNQPDNEGSAADAQPPQAQQSLAHFDTFWDQDGNNNLVGRRVPRTEYEGLEDVF